MTPLSAPAPAGLSLFRDAHGIPHIRAAHLNEVYWGMGYCHALDRPMQLCLMRLLGQGRSAECLDASDRMVEVDTFFRRMNWGGGLDEEIGKLDRDTHRLLQRYCDGVNARLSRHRIWEWRLLGYRPEPWTIGDTLMLSRMIGYLTLAQSQAEVERLFVELVQGGIGDDKLEALFPGSTAHLDRELLAKVTLGERNVPPEVVWELGLPRAMASNNWVVAASHSKTGHALMANDPHLEVDRLPNVWVEQVIELDGDTVITANMPGIPAALVGRNQRLAWGATYTFMDAVDSWVEECRDGAYRRGDEWIAFRVRKETVRKGSQSIERVFYENDHGVLDGDPNVPGFYLATRWAPSDSGAQSMMAAVQMWRAHTVEAGMAALGQLEVSFNWVFADAEGHIGYQMSGRCPRRDPEWNGFAPRPGWEARWDWQGWLDPSELPRVVNPPEGYIVTANQDLNALGTADPINTPMGDYRALRIADLLAAGPSDLLTFRAIQADVFSIQAVEMMQLLEPVLPDTPLARTLKAWDRGYGTASHGATVFEAWYRELLVEMFAPGGLGKPVVRHLAEATGIFIDFYANFDRQLMDPASPWLDGRTLGDVYRAAFDRVTTDADRPWGEVNQVTLKNILFAGKLPRITGFDHGPIALKGGRATPHQGQVYRSGGRDTSFAPSLRILADLGEDVLHTALAGGPQDRRFGWYTTGVEPWLRGEYKPVGSGR